MNDTPIEWADKTVNPKVFQTIFTKKRGCPHDCPYCYVQKFPPIWINQWKEGFFPERIRGRLKNKTIFVESIGDLFHKDVPLEEKVEVLERCKRLDKSNTICLLTKHPAGIKEVLDLIQENFILGLTMESDRYPKDFNNNVDAPSKRAEDFLRLRWEGDSFISGEPLMEMRSKIYLSYLLKIKPKYMLFGLNSIESIKLPEASYESFVFLVNQCKQAGIKIIIKNNMGRWGVKPLLMKIKHSTYGIQESGLSIPLEKKPVQRTLI
jgi:protein gp37